MRPRRIAVAIVLLVVGGVVFIAIMRGGLPEPGQITLSVNVPEVTPPEDTVFIETQVGMHYPMTQTSQFIWEIDLREILGGDWSPEDDFFYRYNRNGLGFVAAERFDPDSATHWRSLNLNEQNTQTDTVERWRWLPNEPLTGYTFPSIPAFPFRLDNESYITGASLLDYYTAEFDALVEPTLEHVAEMNAEWVHIADTYPVTSVNPVVIDMSEGIPEEALTYQVEKANELGLNVAVTLALDECRNATVREELSALLSQDWFDGFFSVFNSLYEEKVPLYESLGIDMLFVPSHGFYPEDQSLESYVNQKLKEQVVLIRSRFSGLLSSDWVMGDAFDFYEDLDMVGTKFMPPGMPENVTTYQGFVENLDQYVENDITPIWEKYNISLILGLSFPSYEGAAQDPYLLEDPRVWEFFPESDEIPMDLQVQIDLYSAALNVLANRTWVRGTFVFGYCYWDSIDKSPSIRAKPSETMFRQWYARLGDLGPQHTRRESQLRCSSPRFSTTGLCGEIYRLTTFLPEQPWPLLRNKLMPSERINCGWQLKLNKTKIEEGVELL